MATEFTLKLTCPICGTKERMRTTLPPIRYYQRAQTGWVPSIEIAAATRFSTGAVCGECHEPFGVVIGASSGGLLYQLLQNGTPDAIDASMQKLMYRPIRECFSRLIF